MPELPFKTLPFTFEGTEYDVIQLMKLNHSKITHYNDMYLVTSDTSLGHLPARIRGSISIFNVSFYNSMEMPDDVRQEYLRMVAPYAFWWSKARKEKLLAEVRAMLEERLKPLIDMLRGEAIVRLEAFIAAFTVAAKPVREWNLKEHFNERRLENLKLAQMRLAVSGKRSAFTSSRWLDRRPRSK